MTRTVIAVGSRARGRASPSHAAPGLPLAERQPAGFTRTDHSLSVREEQLFRAATRRSLRAATRLSGITLTAFLALDSVGMLLLVPGQEGEALAIIGIESIVGLVVAVLALGRWRLPPLPLAVALELSTVVAVLVVLALIPEARTMALMFLAVIPLAVALFLPWSPRAQAGWLVAGLALLAGFSLAGIGVGASTTDWIGVWLVLVISGLVSLVGSVGVSRTRRRAFEEQMQARRAFLRLSAREAELARLNDELAGTARTDPLTGVGNRLRLNEELRAAVARSARYAEDCAIAMFDLDRFKDYNDALGHVAGDAALRRVAGVLAASARTTDIVCRFGGEEFIVLMPRQSVEDAARAAGRILAAIEELHLGYPSPNGRRVLTISAGVALLGQDGVHDEDEALHVVDAALYRAKGRGRNRVETAASPVDRSLALEHSQQGGPA